ncbi:hypothetical protein AX16_003368 [Volvariella volvacea WC 439]|nr:hypothetical protein AX16_003368 [Volvariella volvacea WC 439]
MSHSVAIDISIAFFVLAVFQYLHSRAKNRTPLPPSPRGLPIIGHYLSVPQEEPWITYKIWGDECGSDILCLNMMGTPTIILNSLKSAVELLDKRSAIYSDRHPMPMMTMVGWRFSLTFQPYGPDWRNHRKMFRQQTMASNYKDHEINAVRGFVDRLATTPSKWESSLRHMTGEIIFSTGYGIDIKPEGDPWVELAERCLVSAATAGNVGSYLVDYLSFLNYLPSWFPGAGYQKTIEEDSKFVKSLPLAPYEVVKEKMSKGELKPSIASTMLEELQDDKSDGAAEKERVLRNVLGTMYAAGADTTVSSISTFILAMVQNPEMLKKGQEEVDAVIGNNRLPDFSDKDPESLPYVQALLQETLRWKPVIPLCVQHASTADDIYEGYEIPKGSVVMPNIWAILRDESIFGPDTDTYNPERFLKDGQINPDIMFPEMAFGFGRRICAGKEIALSSVWLSITTILATLDITKAKDKDGNVIEPSGKYSTGMLCYPEPFECDIRFRSKKAEELVKAHLTRKD